MCILKSSGGAVNIKSAFHVWLWLRYVCKWNQVKTCGNKEEPEGCLKGFYFLVIFFQLLYQIYLGSFSPLGSNQKMQKLNEILRKRLISISEISQLTRSLIFERGNFLNPSYTTMEVGGSGRRTGVAVGSDGRRCTCCDGGRGLNGPSPWSTC